jgi:hypothetical protein
MSFFLSFSFFKRAFSVPGLRSNEIQINEQDLVNYRDETREAFLHSYNSYLRYAYPYDELMPLSCGPRKHTNRTRGSIDDVLGGYMLTLIDSLDSLIIFKEYTLFFDALDKISTISFSTDIEVSVFELNIRVLGGLLSAHQLAVELFSDSDNDGRIYDGELLLNLAIDVGNALLPAFNTKTGIPIHKVNLIKGVNKQERTYTCTAAGTSFLLEMGLLSRLTGDPIYESAARKSLQYVWDKRSKNDLVGGLIDVHTGQWLEGHISIGAGVDSFYETILKSSILLGDSHILETFNQAYTAVEKHTRMEGYYREVDMNTKQLFTNYVSALGAFWPALQVLHGDISGGIQTFKQFEGLWDVYGSLPDIYNLIGTAYVT